MGEEKNVFLPWIVLVFGLQNDGVFQSKIWIGKNSMGRSDDGSDEHTIALKDQCQIMMFDLLKNKTPHGIQVVLRNIRRLFLVTKMIS